MLERAVFLDRDGVINESRYDYVKRWEEFRFLPGALAALRALANSPFLVVIITNQSAVGRGLMSSDTLDEIHRRMVWEIRVNGGRVDAIYYCPHVPDAQCSCRKPSPGLFHRAAEEHGIDLARSYSVGDKWTDLEAGRLAGCQGIRVLSGEKQGDFPTGARLYRTVRDLGEAVELILAGEGAPVISTVNRPRGEASN
jgi:D-glycero-D-manno-heptose 1,7-bisphosphate phosphatase